jgi:type IV pilus assembly protein PilW
MTVRMNSGRPAAQRGFSLIELMISIVIGMVVVGAVFATYLSVGTGSRNSRAMAQMTEDVSLAMNILRSHIAMAGFSTPTGVDGTGRFTKNYTGMAVKGCSSAFTSTDAAIDVLACSGVGEDSIAVVFEADERNAIQSGGNFLDCLGNAIPADGSGRFMSYSRFYISNGQLYCRGPGNNAGQALVENIHDMKVWYGVASGGGAVANQVAYYSRAGNAGEMNNADFDRTVSARICLVVTTENEVLDNATAYTDCDGSDVTPADRRLYRAFTQTIVLQNRMGTN